MIKMEQSRISPLPLLACLLSAYLLSACSLYLDEIRNVDAPTYPVNNTSLSN